MVATLSLLPRVYVTVAQLTARQRQLHHDWLAGIGGGCPKAHLRGKPCRFCNCEWWHGVCTDPRNPVDMRRRTA
jgi:hypothetical protein